MISQFSLQPKNDKKNHCNHFNTGRDLCRQHNISITAVNCNECPLYFQQ